jgi:F-type H+-transporting ATPase subunit b
MKAGRGLWLAGAVALLATQPLYAADEPPPSELLFRWLNFLLVVAALLYAWRRWGRRWFDRRAQAIADELVAAQQTLEQARRRLEEAERRLAGLEAEAAGWRQKAHQDLQEEIARIRARTEQEVRRIEQAAAAEIAAAERAAANRLRGLLVERTLQQAEQQLRFRLHAEVDRRLFEHFLHEIAGALP